MKEVKKKVLKGVAKIVENFGKVNDSGWPPPCAGFIYQPKRPKRNNCCNEGETK